MNRFVPERVIRFFKDEEGVTAVECALMLALVVVICIVALTPSPVPADRTSSDPVPLEADRE
jgi:Flp pilus assembly pilin Flp